MTARSSAADASSAAPRSRGNTTSGKNTSACRRSDAGPQASTAAEAAIVLATEQRRLPPRGDQLRPERARSGVATAPREPKPLLHEREQLTLAGVDEEMPAGQHVH